MEYVGIFLILIAAGLRVIGDHMANSAQQPRTTASMRGIPSVPPRAAAFLVAAAGIFIFVTSISSR
ncbi:MULTISPECIES: hypothetical protein [Micrococcaceae]|uniref:hypothetical protein n=1 Tax=Micrococcaceae TaxID=1268 RepID=UPI00027DFD1F|nr:MULTISPECIES: hypothetical protein [Micrococcaceae]AFR28728.1 hypothetical protein ARUE_c18220 [Arthrobacter sp. Rue61a]KUM42269.1 hypothetical protein AR689_01525 [Arthrobacter sp. EpRS71]MBP2266206.1 hypothetical protein [Pseudarthrobacter sp. PvP004]